ncbi:MAG TPA: hypothetical protein V6C85_27045 [Allocoleopsis sp.]
MQSLNALVFCFPLSLKNLFDANAKNNATADRLISLVIINT